MFRYSLWCMSAFCLLFFFLCGIFTETSAQTISTYAGTGARSTSGDGGPATAATIYFPSGVCLNSSNQLFITDGYSGQIRRVDAFGMITTIAGNGSVGFTGDGGPATAAEIGSPTNIVSDKNGNLYFEDADYWRIRKIDTFGVITTVAGIGVANNTGDGGPATNAAVNTPFIVVDMKGNIYFSCSNIVGGTDRYRIREIDTAGIINVIAGNGTGSYSGDGGSATAAGMIPAVLAVDKAGNIYFDDSYRIRRIDAATGIITTICGIGTPGYSGDGFPATAAQIGLNIFGIEVDDAGNIYLADQSYEVIRKIDRLGRISTIAGTGTAGYTGDGGPATAATISYPCQIAKYGGGNIFFADANNNVIRMISDTNHAVYFTGGHSLLFRVCAASVSIDSLLQATDADTGNIDSWQPVSAPLHGTVAATYDAYTTGGSLTPSGLTYTPNPGYIGFDTFMVSVTDGYSTDTTIIYVRIDTSLPYAGVIMGTDSLCVGHTIALTDTTAIGAWSGWAAGNTNATIAAGTVTGAAAGTDTIYYIESNGCGIDTARYSLTIKNCVNDVPVAPAVSAITIWPNPAGNTLTIEAAGYDSYTISNITGQALLTQVLAHNKTEADISTLPVGMYYIILRGEDGYAVRKFVKQ